MSKRVVGDQNRTIRAGDELFGGGLGLVSAAVEKPLVRYRHRHHRTPGLVFRGVVALGAADDRVPRPFCFEGLGGLGRTPAEPDEAGKHTKHEHHLRVWEVVRDFDSFFHRTSP